MNLLLFRVQCSITVYYNRKSELVEFQRKDIMILLELIVSCPFRTIIQLDNNLYKKMTL